MPNSVIFQLFHVHDISSAEPEPSFSRHLHRLIAFRAKQPTTAPTSHKSNPTHHQTKKTQGRVKLDGKTQRYTITHGPHPRSRGDGEPIFLRFIMETFYWCDLRTKNSDFGHSAVHLHVKERAPGLTLVISSLLVLRSVFGIPGRYGGEVTVKR